MIPDKEIGKGLVKLHVIWAGMLTSLGLYLFVGLQFAGTSRDSMNEDTFAILKPVLYLLAIFGLFMIRYIKRVILSSKNQSRQAIQYFQHPVLQQYATAMMVTWTLSESIGIFGLVLLFLGKNATDLYLLILISAVAMFMYRPRKKEMMSLLQKSGEASKTGTEPLGPQ